MVSKAIRAEDLVHSRTLAYRRRVEQARRVVEQACGIGKIGVSWSGGKDSTVLLHLIRTVVPDAPAALFDSGVEMPATLELARALGVIVIEPRLSAREIGRYCGWWGAVDPVDKGCPFDAKAVLIEEPAEVFVVRWRLSVLGVGLRAEESRARRWVQKTRGPLFQGRDRTWYLMPLLPWRSEDVWAYIAAHDLTYHPAYDAMAQMGLPRDRWRIGMALDATPEALGSLAVLRRVAPDWFAALAAEFPGLRESAG